CELMSATELDENDLQSWRALIVATGAVDWIEQQIDSRLSRALDWIDTGLITDGVRATLADLAAACTERSACCVRSRATPSGGRGTNRVVVVGGGLAGLSAALHLAGRGRAVTVVERGRHPGGRVGRLDIDGYRLDTGPTVLTMPDIIDDAFAAVGDSLSQRLDV